MSNRRNRIYRSDNIVAETERNLGRTGEAMALRGQAGRFPARHLASHLRRQGFIPTVHFLERFLQRAQSQGVRFDPRIFGREFAQARHFRQTRPGYNTRIAVVRGMPIVYRAGGENANRIVLVGLLPEGAMPPVTPVGAPRQREA